MIWPKGGGTGEGSLDLRDCSPPIALDPEIVVSLALPTSSQPPISNNGHGRPMTPYNLCTYVSMVVPTNSPQATPGHRVVIVLVEVAPGVRHWLALQKPLICYQLSVRMVFPTYWGGICTKVVSKGWRKE